MKPRNATTNPALRWGIALSVALGVVGAAEKFPLREEETIERSFRFAPGATRHLTVDNIEGDISITGKTGPDVYLRIRKTIRAETTATLENARREVRLDLEHETRGVVAYIDAPWRERDGRSGNSRRRYGYRARYDFEIVAPEETGLFLRTINDGEIRVQSIGGDFDVENINGGIEMISLAGSGRAYALNGKVTIEYRKNPTAASYFGSLNGDVKVRFPADLAADLRFKTFNGSVYTDFPVTYLPPGEPHRDRRNGKFVYKSDRFQGVRIGRGGPEIKFDAFNGDIHVLEDKR